MWADDYVRRYHTIEVPVFAPSQYFKLFGSGMIRTPVKEYLNGRHKSNYAGTETAQIMNFKQSLFDFFKARCKEPDTGITYDGGYTLHCSTQPIVSFPKIRFMTCFTGKGSPDTLAKLIQLISYWRDWQVHIEGKTDTAALPTLVERYLGEDCNGFVGNYIKDKFPNVELTYNTPEETVQSYGGRKGGATRKTCLELQDDDIIVFSGHIAVIDTVLVSVEDEAQVTISESKNDRVKNGGPQTNTHMIRLATGAKKLKGDRWSSTHSLTPLWIGRVPGM